MRWMDVYVQVEYVSAVLSLYYVRWIAKFIHKYIAVVVRNLFVYQQFNFWQLPKCTEYFSVPSKG